MIRKILWMMILLVMTGCTILFSEGGEIIINPTATSVVCADCTPVPTEVVISTETPEPAATDLPTSEPVTATPEPTQTLNPTATLEPTFTSTMVLPTATMTTIPATATKTAIPSTATKTVVPSATNTSTTEIYAVQPATPVFMQNFIHTAEGCAWQGVAGQVFDASGKPVTNLIVKVSGYWEGKGISLVGITGMVSGLPYGPGSYEIVLGNAAYDTVDQLQIQIFSSNQTPLTVPLSFSTSADCSKNLVIINFKAK
ncbi:MAG: hypothetical protein KBF64_03345 [Anaerolineaceae bacterium]|nr:hypothetical protein [Anaerolineaceae bacterium]